MPPCHSLFVPHCAPTFALHPGAAGAALNAKARQLPKPRAIIISSAHWSTAVPTLGSAGQLETIHDFSGFPDELYTLSYPARGCREAVEEVVAAISRSGMSVRQDGGRGLDHGAWVPLRLMYPDADIPVIPLSIQRRGGPQEAIVSARHLLRSPPRAFSSSPQAISRTIWVTIGVLHAPARKLQAMSANLLTG